MIPALSFDGFEFAYPGGPKVVGPVSWQVEEGSFTLLVGLTGSGKTTLLKNAKAPLAPVGESSGSVSVFGRDARGLSIAESSELVGYVSQSPDNQLVCDTVWHEMAFGLENLGLPQEEMRRRVAEVAHFFGIAPWFHRGVNELSGGQRQLLNLASVLVMQPRLLLLDEPTAQLDPVAQRNFCHALFRLNRELGLTVVVATHAPHLMAPYATECVCLEEGALRSASLDEYAEGPLPPSMMERPGKRAAGQGTVTPRAAAKAVVLKDAYVRYSRDEAFVLAGADLEVSAGSVHALVGGNGAGKSTLLRAIAGTMKPARGRVENALARSQALLPQDPKALFACDTAMDELMEWSAACGYGEGEAKGWLSRIGLVDRASNHPYDLSGGQQQLLAFAKLALTGPQLLLLDEPAKGLDPWCKLLLADQVKAMQETGCTVVLATHDLAFAACVADDVSMLFDGQVTSTEPTAEFFRRNLFYRPAKDAFVGLWASRGL